MVNATLDEFNDMNSMEVVRCQRSEYEECGSPARSGLRYAARSPSWYWLLSSITQTAFTGRETWKCCEV